MKLYSTCWKHKLKSSELQASSSQPGLLFAGTSNKSKYGRWRLAFLHYNDIADFKYLDTAMQLQTLLHEDLDHCI
jgi:hypothetical protein